MHMLSHKHIRITGMCCKNVQTYPIILNPACTSGSSLFVYCWSLALRILSIIVLACQQVHIVTAMIFPVVVYRCEIWTIKRLCAKELMLSGCGAKEDTWESLGQQGDQTSQSERKSTLNSYWKDWCWTWNSNTVATWWEELTSWKRPWC